jgi:hypothetical protein
MRTQRRAPVRVRLTVSGVVLDELGDVDDAASTPPVVTVVDGATFDPERIVEAPRSQGPQTVLPAVFNVPGAFQLGPDDVVEILAPADQDTVDGPVVLSTWDVEGGSALWRDRTKIPVTRAATEAAVSA